MKFGITFFPSVGPAEKNPAEYYDECVLLAKLADSLDFHHVRTVEHYFFAYGGYSPDPVTLLTALAAHTRTIRLGTSAVIPAFTHPVQLAGKLAMLDNLSHGRLDVGFGRAFLPDEFRAFDISMDESQTRFDEGIAACKLLWSQEDVVWKGTHHAFGPVTSLPRPFQQPHPPVYITTARSIDSCIAAGKAGHNIQMVGAILSREQIQDRLAAYRSAWKEAGYEPGTELIQLSYPAFVDEDGAKAREIGAFDDARNGEAISQAVRSWSGTSSKAYPGYEKLAEQLIRPDLDQKIAENQILAGTPDEVSSQVAQIADWFGSDVILSLGVHTGQVPVEAGETTIRLIAEHLLPKFG
ncbi:LLM class flavin-dependent oxidoreductase [Jatrophihabitans sp. DSM 44399]|uniref:LLM class flavin-dependent oxidoreductase n=2 Tax=Jatrophihabitans lederbergiae TaxID=3075547 RepID=A0ABU2JHN5_9ACTN|nr:LLM class flavin-dependent oxidoreductase [Jatrophihabitans sp. DSM 44399]